jgi:hypothetical protein
MTPDDAASRLISKEISPQEWAALIHEKGAAILHGQLNPFWFNDETTPKPVHNTGYDDHGFINTRQESTTVPGDPHGRIAKIAEIATKDNRKKETEFIVLGPIIDQDKPINSEVIEVVKQLKDAGLDDQIPELLANEYNLWRAQRFNTLRLNSKMTGKWRKVEIEMYEAIQQAETPEGPILSFRSKDYPLPIDMNIYLPAEEAMSFFQTAQNNPSLLRSLIGSLYPKIFQEPYGLQLVKPNRLIAVESDGKSEAKEILKSAHEIPII